MDEEENQVPELSSQTDETQIDQVASTENEADAPEVQSEKEELILGKFKSQDDLAKSYQELEQKTTRTAQENAEMKRMLGQIQSPPIEQSQQLDPEVVPALDSWYQERRAREKQQEELEKARAFRERHADELKDPVLDGTVIRLMSESRANNVYLDQEEALAQAKKLLDERVKPRIKEAQSEGMRTGAEFAQKKAQMGTIGDTPSNQKVDTDDLTADEFAKHFNLPRAKS